MSSALTLDRETARESLPAWERAVSDSVMSAYTDLRSGCHAMVLVISDYGTPTGCKEVEEALANFLASSVDEVANVHLSGLHTRLVAILSEEAATALDCWHPEDLTDEENAARDEACSTLYGVLDREVANDAVERIIRAVLGPNETRGAPQ